MKHKRKRVICPKCKERVTPERSACDYPYFVHVYCPLCGYTFSEIVDYETMGANSSL